MAGHFGRPGAVRKGRKGTKVGSGGRRRAALEGKGPTPKAEDRTYHPAYRRKKEAQARARAAEPKLRGVLRIAPGHELIVGRNPVSEAVACGIPYLRVFAAAALANDERVSAVLRAAMEKGVPCVEVTRTELDLMSGNAAHQGVALEVPPYGYADIGDLIDAAHGGSRPGLIVALDGVTDPHNLGAVARSAAAFGADGILLPVRRSASVSAAAWKVSAGALARIPVARETNLVRALQTLQKEGYFAVGLAGEADTALADLQLAGMPLVLVIGSEGSGLSRLVRETCDVLVSIPISSRTESLNAAVAAGIALYQTDLMRK